jgi:hypothetical protein
MPRVNLDGAPLRRSQATGRASPPAVLPRRRIPPCRTSLLLSGRIQASQAPAGRLSPRTTSRSTHSQRCFSTNPGAVGRASVEADAPALDRFARGCGSGRLDRLTDRLGTTDETRWPFSEPTLPSDPARFPGVSRQPPTAAALRRAGIVDFALGQRRAWVACVGRYWPVGAAARRLRPAIRLRTPLSPDCARRGRRAGETTPSGPTETSASPARRGAAEVFE